MFNYAWWLIVFTVGMSKFVLTVYDIVNTQTLSQIMSSSSTLCSTALTLAVFFRTIWISLYTFSSSQSVYIALTDIATLNGKLSGVRPVNVVCIVSIAMTVYIVVGDGFYFGLFPSVFGWNSTLAYVQFKYNISSPFVRAIVAGWYYVSAVCFTTESVSMLLLEACCIAFVRHAITLWRRHDICWSRDSVYQMRNKL